MFSSRTIVVALAVSLLLAAPPGHAGDQLPMVFTHLTTADGLSQASVNDVLQDSQGFIWLATENGLNRYDGVNVRRFQRERDRPDGLASDFIWALDEDSAGNLWLATEGGGVAVWNRRTDRISSFRNVPGDEQSLGSDSVRSVLVDRRGQVWAATRDAGVSVLDPATGKVRRLTHDPARPDSLSSNRNIYAMLEDRDGAIWIGTAAGLDRYLGAGNRFQHFAPPLVAGGEHKILALTEDLRGEIWLGSFDVGLQRFDPVSSRFTAYRHLEQDPSSLSSDDVRAIYEDAQSRLWVGTAAGLNLLDRRSGTFQRYQHDRADPRSLADDFVISIASDRSGLLWVGTKSGGVSRWNPHSWSLGHRVPDWLSGGAILAAFADAPDGGLWIGTMGAGLLRLPPGSLQPVPVERYIRGGRRSFSDERVMSLLNDRAGQLWIGTMSNGLARLGADGSMVTFRASGSGASGLGADGIMSLHEDQAGRIWIGTFEGGVSAYDPETGAIRRYRDTTGNAPWFERVRAAAIQEDRQGRIWVATDGDGLLLLDARSGLVHQFRYESKRPGSLSSDAVYALHLDGAGTLWVGTGGGGLDRITDMAAPPAAMRFENFSQADGLSNDVIYGIEEDSAGMLWLPSNNGLMRLDPRTRTVRTFHATHGAQGEEFSSGASFRAADGRLLFGGTQGYNDFDPRKLQQNDQPPPVVLTAVEVLNQPLRSEIAAPVLDQLTLQHDQNVLTLEFAALDFADPRRNQYAYRLEGFDDDWISLGDDRRARYTNIGAGRYVFKVRAASADSVWNENGISLPVTVLPAPWRTWWAYLVYGALALLLVAALHRQQTERLRREQVYARRLAAEVNDRTAQLQQRNAELAEASAAKSSFLARMSHEIRTPMNGVMGMTELLSGTDLNSQQRHYTQTISRSADALLHIINDILDLSKIEAGKLELAAEPFELENLIDDCVGVLAPQAGKKGIDLVVAVSPELPARVLGDELRVRQVLVNLLSNAVKFTAEGEVVVRAVQRWRDDGTARIRVEVTDTGIGMEEQALQRIFDAFSQADETTTRRFGGTGLGLAICKSLVEMMGGEIGVVSRPGVGSTFWFEIPFQVSPATAAASAGRLAGLRVVVATPVRALSGTLAERLADAGADVVLATSSAELASIVRDRNDCHVLVIDADRLSRSGALQGALALPADARVARIFLSRQPRGGDAATMVIRPRDLYLAKPVAWRSLQQAILEMTGAVTDADASGASGTDAGEGASDGAGRHVLLVEDNPVNQLVAEGMLRKLGYAVTSVADGRNAVTRASTEQYDLVLMDCQMPILDGLAATRLIRGLPGSAGSVPIIGLTADASTEARAACEAAGMNDYLSKPYTLEKLRGVLLRQAIRLRDASEVEPRRNVQTGQDKATDGANSSVSGLSV